MQPAFPLWIESNVCEGRCMKIPTLMTGGSEGRAFTKPQRASSYAAARMKDLGSL